MSETGVVIDVKGDQVVVEMEASKECEACGACRYTKAGRLVATIANSLNARVGDVVKIEIEPQMVIAAALIVYILPLFFFFAGYALALWLGRVSGLIDDSAAIWGGVGLFALSYFAVRNIDRRARISHRFEPKMCDIIREEK